MAEDKKRFHADIQQLSATLETPVPPSLAKLTYGELSHLQRDLQDRLNALRVHLTTSIATVGRLWEIMAVPTSSRFPLDSTDLRRSNLERLEAEKKRLFDLQKERFREMLGEQERELKGLWDELETPEAEREAALESMRALSPADTLDRQSALIASLRSLSTEHSAIRSKAEKRAALIQRMREFEVSAADPNRLFGSSFRLNQEERFRKAAYPTLVKIEGDLEAMLEAFRAKHGKEAVVDGRPLRETLIEDKENRFINDTTFAFFTSPASSTAPPPPPTTSNNSQPTAKRRH